jgi:tetratricopeptide (TPR) repeat protein
MLARTRAARAFGFGTLWVSLLMSSPCRAAEPDARAWFEQGVKAYEEGRYTAALAALQEAHRLTPRPGLLFSIAQAFRRIHEETGDLSAQRDAIAHYTRYLDESPEGERSGEARSRLAQLESTSSASKLVAASGKLLLSINVAAARVELDGVALSSPYESSVTPGRHHLTIAADGYEAQARDVEVKEGASVAIEVQLRPLTSLLEITGNSGAVLLVDGQRVATFPMPPLRIRAGRHTLKVMQDGHHGVSQKVDLQPGESRHLHLSGAATARRVGSWLLIGAGSAAIVAAGALGYVALRHEEDARALQSVRGAQLDFGTALSARDRFRTAAILSAGIGASSVVGGTISLLTEGPGAVHPAPAASFPSVDVAWPAGVTLSGMF